MAGRQHLVLILAAVALVAVEGTLRTQPRLLKPRHQQPHLHSGLLAAAVTNQDCQDQANSCTDCTTQLTCVKIANSYKPVTFTPCPASTPYCVGAGQCSATTTDKTCIDQTNKANGFECNLDGYFPSPSNCRKYYYCTDKQAYEYDCTQYGTTTLYGPARAMCVPTSESVCSVASCTTATIGQYQKWRPNQSVYFVCVDTDPSHAYVADCGADRVIDAKTGECVLTCEREGRIADDSNRKQYYECVKTSATATTYVGPTVQTCPGNSVFDASQERCVHSDSPPEPDEDEIENYFKPTNDKAFEDKMYKLPEKLIIGAASAAYQVEGGWDADDKTPSIWDAFFHQRRQQYPDNGDVAADSYHKWRDDIDALDALGMKAYRFSISWPRLLPTGKKSEPSVAGTDYYMKIIDELQRRGMEPIITLHHWDIPNSFQQEFGGWLDSEIVNRFDEYADYAFQTFGDKVKYWILMNEPHIFCQMGYDRGSGAPGISEPGSTGLYLCVHNMILAHAKAYHNYHDNYNADKRGRIGSSFDIQYAQAASNKEEDKAAAERAMVFGLGWLTDPFMRGDYPQAMIDTVLANSLKEGLTQSRLPSFTEEEKQSIKGAIDFIGINHYTTTVVSAPVTASTESEPSYTNDMNVVSTSKDSWRHSARYVFAICPWGLRGTLNWLKNRYPENPEVFITENGYGGPPNETVHDPDRLFYYSTYMRAMARAINQDGCNVIGYTAWCLEDNLEWASGYSIKFGLVHVDYSSPDLTRTPKYSSKLFKEVNTDRYVNYYEE